MKPREAQMKRKNPIISSTILHYHVPNAQLSKRNEMAMKWKEYGILCDDVHLMYRKAHEEMWTQQRAAIAAQKPCAGIIRVGYEAVHVYAIHAFII